MRLMTMSFHFLNSKIFLKVKDLDIFNVKSPHFITLASNFIYFKTVCRLEDLNSK